VDLVAVDGQRLLVPLELALKLTVNRIVLELVRGVPATSSGSDKAAKGARNIVLRIHEGVVDGDHRHLPRQLYSEINASDSTCAYIFAIHGGTSDEATDAAEAVDAELGRPVAAEARQKT
jgi:hypothetical protein